MLTSFRVFQQKMTETTEWNRLLLSTPCDIMKKFVALDVRWILNYKEVVIDLN